MCPRTARDTLASARLLSPDLRISAPRRCLDLAAQTPRTDAVSVDLARADEEPSERTGRARLHIAHIAVTAVLTIEPAMWNPRRDRRADGRPSGPHIQRCNPQP